MPIAPQENILIPLCAYGFHISFWMRFTPFMSERYLSKIMK